MVVIYVELFVYIFLFSTYNKHNEYVEWMLDKSERKTFRI